MANHWRGWVVGLVACLLLSACAQTPANPSQSPAGGAAPQAQTAPHGNLRVAFAREPETLNPKFLPGGGAGDYTWLFSSAFAIRDMNYVAHPMIARELPSQSNGDWVINPDGTMVTTYRIRENARWHDGMPLVAGDFAFAYGVFVDPAVTVVSAGSDRLMSSVEARDDRTVVIRWREPYIFANRL